MRICQFKSGGIGLVEGDAVRDISPLMRRIPPQHYPFKRGDAFIAQFPMLRGAIEEEARKAISVPLSSVLLASPVANPGKFIAAPVNYAAHLTEAINEPETFSAVHVRRIEETGLFLKATSSMAGPADAIRIAFKGRRTDHEVELAVIIGRTCRNIACDEALSAVAGYCIGLDITIRGPEERSLRKSIDTYSVLGPWMVTADEIGDPGALGLSLAVNGEIRQRANTRDLFIDVPGLIAFASRWYTLEPGDVIFTGTPEGVGPIVPGDVIHAQIDRIGAFEMKVEAA